MVFAARRARRLDDAARRARARRSWARRVGRARRLRRGLHGHAGQLLDLHQRADASAATRTPRCGRCSHDPKVRAGLRCGPVSTPNHKLIPDSRWLLDAPAGKVIARSDAHERSRIGRGVAIYAVNRQSLLRSGFTAGDDSDGGHLQLDPDGGLHAGGVHAVLQRLCPLLSAAVLSRAARRTAPGSAAAAQRRWPWWLGLALVLAAALGLRVWGVKQGLPFAYNADENAHFVPQRDRPLRARLEPALLRQPAGLHVPAARRLRRLVRRRATGVSQRARDQPDRGLRRRARDRRGCSARSRCGCCTSPARGCFGRARRPARRGAAGRRVPAGLLLAPRAQRRADARADRAVAVGHRRACCATAACATTCWPGVGLGLACATKYTGGIVLLPLRRRPARSGCAAAGRARRRARAGSCSPGVVALAAFVVANPYARARPRGLPRRPAATRPTPPTTRWASSA